MVHCGSGVALEWFWDGSGWFWVLSGLVLGSGVALGWLYRVSGVVLGASGWFWGGTEVICGGSG